jgi:hypothetical protein
MNRRVNVLQWLRRRKAGISSLLCPALATVWFSASASLCFGMAATIDASAATGSDHALDGHAHAEHPGGQQHTPAPPPHEPQHGHGGCPHCPPSPTQHGAMPSAHVKCGTLADSTPVSKEGQPDLKGAPHALAFYRAAAFPVAIPQRTSHSHDYHPLDVPLNLRHCVFLI